MLDGKEKNMNVPSSAKEKRWEGFTLYPWQET